MRWSAATLGRKACWVAILSACAVAGMIVAWPTGEDRVRSTADVGNAFDTRFSDVKETTTQPEAQVAREIDDGQRALFAPHLSVPQTAAPPTSASLVMPVEQPVKPMPSPAPASKPSVAAVLNDAQIASIKQRLKLTPDQEQMWPAVEAALRKLAYAKHDRGRRKPGAQDAAGRLAMIAPANDDVEHLKSAAVPLIMSFSEDQERELRILAQIAGLEKLIPGRNADRP